MSVTSADYVRLIDVARAAGVSHAAAGHVLHGAGRNIRVSPVTAQRVREQAQRLGYRPDHAARQLRGVSSGLIAALLGDDHDESVHHHLRALQRQARRRGRRLLLGCLREPLDELASRRVETVLCVGPVSPDEARRVSAALPCVFIEPGAPVTGASISCDLAAAGRLVTLHLAQRGRKRIALALRRGDTAAAQALRRGYAEALLGQRLTLDEKLIWKDAQTDTQHACDAVVASDDLLAAHWMHLLLRRGLSVPRDVAVVGVGNLSVGRSCVPGLTTVDPGYDAAAQAALDLAQETEKTRVLIEPALVVRGSS